MKIRIRHLYHRSLERLRHSRHVRRWLRQQATRLNTTVQVVFDMLVNGGSSEWVEAQGSIDPIPSWDGLPKNRTLAILGDSIAFNNSSPQSGFQSHGYITRALALSGQRFIFDHSRNFGVGGDTAPLAEVRMPTTIASGAGLIVMNIGTNDGANADPVATCIDSMVRMRDAALAAERTIVFVTPAPRGNDVNGADKRLNSTQLAKATTIKSRMLAELPKKGCYVVDNHEFLLKAGTENDAKDNYTSDGLHPLATGAYWWCLKLADLMKTLAPPLDDMPTIENSAGQVNVNALMTGTGGSAGTNGSGQVATGWQGANATSVANTVRTYSKVTKGGKEWQQIVLSGPAPASAGATDLIRQTSLQAKVTPGKTYEAVCFVEWDSDVAFVTSCQLGWYYNIGATVGQSWDNNNYTGVSYLPKVGYSGQLRSPRFVCPEGLTDLRLRVIAYLTPDGAPAGTFRLTTMLLREVTP